MVTRPSLHVSVWPGSSFFTPRISVRLPLTVPSAKYSATAASSTSGVDHPARENRLDLRAEHQVTAGRRRVEHAA